MAGITGAGLAAAKQRTGYSSTGQKVKSKRRRKRCNGKLARRRQRDGAARRLVCVKTSAHHSKNAKYAWRVWRHHRSSGGTGTKAGGTGSGTGTTGTGTGTTGSTGGSGSTGIKPSDLTPPSISGSTVVGSTLNASAGSWSGSPDSYTYQWQLCEASGEGCQNIAGATSTSYALISADVGDTIGVSVTASNPSGSSSAKSATTAPIDAASAPGSTQEGCVSDPSSCGYPDSTNSGVPAGVSLSSATEDRHVGTAGSTVKDLALTGTIYVEANNVTIEDSEVIVDGSQSCSGSCGGKGIWIKPGVSGTKIDHVTCRGGAASGSNVTQYCVQSNDAVTRVEDSRMYDCTECYTGPGEVIGSFLEDNGTISGEHYEDVYYGGGEGALIIEHDTMLNPHNQTAAVFASVDFGNQTTLRIENSLLAGGDYVIYGGGSGSGGTVIGPVIVKDNRFSRVFFPNGGSYGVDSYMNKSVTEWSGNYWDETLAPVAEE